MGSKEKKERQRRILKFIKKYTDTNGYPPTVREIGEGANISSTSLVSYYLKALEEKGLIVREPSVSRGIRVPDPTAGKRSSSDRDTVAIPYLGFIGASTPRLMLDTLEDETVEVSRSLLDYAPEELFALHVEGTSMIDALINDGDLVILRQQEQVENGQMAAVWINNSPGETTLKKVYYEGQRVRLQPANPLMAPIYVPANQVQVQGKVVMVIRQLD